MECTCNVSFSRVIFPKPVTIAHNLEAKPHSVYSLSSVSEQQDHLFFFSSLQSPKRTWKTLDQLSEKGNEQIKQLRGIWQD